MATYQWVQHLQENTVTSKVYGIPDSGLFLVNYESPIVHEKVVEIRAENLFKLIGSVNE